MPRTWPTECECEGASYGCAPLRKKRQDTSRLSEDTAVEYVRPKEIPQIVSFRFPDDHGHFIAIARGCQIFTCPCVTHGSKYWRIIIMGMPMIAYV